MSDFNSGINKATDIISGVARSLVTLLLSLFVLFVFAHVLFGGDAAAAAAKATAAGKVVAVTGWKAINPITGLIALIDKFMDGSFTGLLALVFFVGFLTNSKWNG